MQIVPVLEIRHGKCVHTEHKNSFVDEVIREDVLQVVKRWSDNGINRIHIVDVDAIESGEPENIDLITKIKTAFPGMQIQVIGGIKCVESAYIWVDAGADFLVLNGKATRQPDLLDDICMEFPNHVLVEVDCRQAKAKSTSLPGIDLIKLAQKLENDGVVGLVVTDLARESEVENPDGLGMNLVREIGHSIDIPVFASSGIEKMEDLKRLLDSKTNNLTGILIGKAIHNGGFCLAEAQTLIGQHHAI